MSTNDIKEKLNLTVFKQTVRNRSKECGFSSGFTLKKNFVSEKNRKLRLAGQRNMSVGQLINETT